MSAAAVVTVEWPSFGVEVWNVPAGDQRLHDIRRMLGAPDGDFADTLRADLLTFATWLLKDEFGEGREAQIVDRYLAERTAAGAAR